MIKTDIIENIDSLPFPKLMKSIVTGSIFLMRSPTMGTKLKSEDAGYDHGLSTGGYNDHLVSENLIDFKGSITITNEDN
jgi:hypothetical protein